jgi:hypothetical protein
LFFDGRAYGLAYKPLRSDGRPGFRIEFREQTPALGELRLSGEFLNRVLLFGSSGAILLDKPARSVSVPVGEYGQICVSVKADKAEALREFVEPPLSLSTKACVTISQATPASLVLGGPLTNTVVPSRRGKHLVLSYRLVGADGCSYRLLDTLTRQAPQFTVSRKGKVLHAGLFEFG